MFHSMFFWGPEPIKRIMEHYHVDLDDHRNMVEETVAQLNVVLWLCSTRWAWPLDDRAVARRHARVVLAEWQRDQDEVDTDDLWSWCDGLAEALAGVLGQGGES